MVQLAVCVHVYPIQEDRISRYLSNPQNLFDWENYFLQRCAQMSSLRTSGRASWCQQPSWLWARWRAQSCSRAGTHAPWRCHPSGHPWSRVTGAQTWSCGCTFRCSGGRLRRWQWSYASSSWSPRQTESALGGRHYRGISCQYRCSQGLLGHHEAQTDVSVIFQELLLASSSKQDPLLILKDGGLLSIGMLSLNAYHHPGRLKKGYSTNS